MKWRTRADFFEEAFTRYVLPKNTAVTHARHIGSSGNRGAGGIEASGYFNETMEIGGQSDQPGK
jgi:hypothetical protein